MPWLRIYDSPNVRALTTNLYFRPTCPKFPKCPKDTVSTSEPSIKIKILLLRTETSKWPNICKNCTKGLRNAERPRKFYSKHTQERYCLQLRLLDRTQWEKNPHRNQLEQFFPQIIFLRRKKCITLGYDRLEVQKHALKRTRPISCHFHRNRDLLHGKRFYLLPQLRDTAGNPEKAM